MKVIEYRVRPVTRYIITRYHSISYDNGRAEAGSEVVGMCESAYQANRTCTALGGSEAEAQIFLVDEPDIQTVPSAE